MRLRTLPILVCLLYFWSPGFVSNAAEEIGNEGDQYIAALKAFDQEIVKNPKSISAFSNRGDIKMFLGQFEEAVADYEKMIAIDPAQDAPHWRLGIGYYFVGAFQKAAKQFEKYHAFDGRDRENGVWKFLSQARAEGIEAARQGMLKYDQFDREPFPGLYEMLAGTRKPDEVLKEAREKGVADDKQVQFFAKYYTGVYLALTGKKAEGSRLVNEAATLFTLNTAARGGPGYMWQVARLHGLILQVEARAEKGTP